MKQANPPSLDLDLLTALGYGPDAVLMNEPRLFVNRRFLASLILELEDDLEPDTALAVLFQIGLMQGLRDASRILGTNFQSSQPGGLTLLPPAESTPIAIRFSARASGGASPSELEIPGCWPERFEAETRMAKVGPSDEPSCLLSAGYTSGWLSGILDIDILVLETECACCNQNQCRFVARELSAWREADDPWMKRLLPTLNFAALREAASRDLPKSATAVAPPDTVALDPSATEVQIWGPVMVLPFTGPDEVVQSIDRLGQDPQTCNVRVVVFDLRGRVLDESFDAVAIEVAIETIESWGAEVILTGISPLSEGIASEAISSHLLLRKNLAEAIAAAFQVADAQRHLL